jgi:hypothetical protein
VLSFVFFEIESNKQKGSLQMRNLILFFALAAVSMTASATPVYEYVGSWFVDDGPSINDQNARQTLPVLSGIEAAAYIFGGNAEDYVTSTVSDQVADINFSAWMDGWADPFTYGLLGNPAAQDLHIDINNDGLYLLPFGRGYAYSAYVSDHAVHLQNFAFRLTSVPEPTSLVLLTLGIIGLGFSRKKAA